MERWEAEKPIEGIGKVLTYFYQWKTKKDNKSYLGTIKKETIRIRMQGEAGEKTLQ